MRLATYNANSIRVRLPSVLDWLKDHQPDVLGLQETKVDDPEFPAREFQVAGWHVEFHGQKARNGVAIVSRTAPDELIKGLPLDGEDDKRLIAARFGDLWVVNTYVPNGTQVGTDKFAYKLRWFDELLRFFQERFRPDQPVVWLGDVNVAPTPDDVFDSPRHLGGVGHHPDEFAALGKVVDWGWIDLFRKFHQGPGHYTFWEFVIRGSVSKNLGWRIDHIYGTKPVAERCASCFIDKEPRLQERPSDHTYVVADVEGF
ncbi:MAG: exodeoxyribonuclease III [Fimbriimonadales bacterium]|nr:exodeoxyribonuclease III [Fimbriimonadales bacterium]